MYPERVCPMFDEYLLFATVAQHRARFVFHVAVANLSHLTRQHCGSQMARHAKRSRRALLSELVNTTPSVSVTLSADRGEFSATVAGLHSEIT